MATYATLVEFRDAYRIDDTIDDQQLQIALDSASRQVDEFCGWSFTDAGSASARVFSAKWRDLIVIDPFSTTTGLVIATDPGLDGTYETTWTTADYQLEPLNGLGAGGQTVPWYMIRAIKSLYFPVSREAGVQVTAQWGWASIPEAVKQATLLQAMKIHDRRNNPANAVSFDVGGRLLGSGLDKDAETLLAGYRKLDLTHA